jgi:hypothetical protein
MENKYITFECPHCNQIIQVFVKEFNCKIFRHGVYKKNLKQIDPHLKKNECENLLNEGLIYGCGKPFEIIINNNQYKIDKCDYI